MSFWKQEPALVTGAVGAVVALAVSFGLPVTVEQVGFIMAAVSAVLAIVTRSQVFAPANVVVQAVGAGTFAGPASSIPTGAPVTVQAVPDPAAAGN